MKESLIKDEVVGGVRSDQLRARLSREANLTLLKAEDTWALCMNRDNDRSL